jgi:hypothetical protein
MRYFLDEAQLADLRQSIEVRLETQASVAKRLGVDRGTLSRWCRHFHIKTQRTGPRSGPGHPDWKGGRIRDADGYVLVYTPGHPHARKRGAGKPVYVAEHRLVMEKTLGRYLLPTEVVHHVNGVNDDNRPENLELFQSNGEHLRHELTGKCPKWSPEGFQRMKDCNSADGKRRRLAGLEKARATRKASEQDESPKR